MPRWQGVNRFRPASAWQGNAVHTPHLRIGLDDGVQQGAGVQLPPLLQVRVSGGPAATVGPLVRSMTSSRCHM